MHQMSAIDVQEYHFKYPWNVRKREKALRDIAISGQNLSFWTKPSQKLSTITGHCRSAYSDSFRTPRCAPTTFLPHLDSTHLSAPNPLNFRPCTNTKSIVTVIVRWSPQYIPSAGGHYEPTPQAIAPMTIFRAKKPLQLTANPYGERYMEAAHWKAFGGFVPCGQRYITDTLQCIPRDADNLVSWVRSWRRWQVSRWMEAGGPMVEMALPTIVHIAATDVC